MIKKIVKLFALIFGFASSLSLVIFLITKYDKCIFLLEPNFFIRNFEIFGGLFSAVILAIIIIKTLEEAFQQNSQKSLANLPPLGKKR